MKKYIAIVLLITSVFFTKSCSKDDDVIIPKSEAKEIISFLFSTDENGFLENDVTAVIDEENKTITVSVPYGTDVTALIPTIEVSAEATLTSEGEQSFTNSATYTVTAQDETTVTYTLTVEIAFNSEKELLSFVFLAENNTHLIENVTATINEENKTITANVPYGTDVTTLIPTIEVSAEATLTPEGDQSFTNSVTYTVTAQDETTVTYTVTVEIASNSEKELLSFVFLAENNIHLIEDVIATIDEENKTITASVPYGTDITELLPTIEVSVEAIVTPQEVQNFINSIIYTVTAQDETTAIYSSIITFEAPSQREVLLAIYNQNPDNRLDWDIESEDISDWAGVVVDEQGNIIRLYLKSAALKSLPPEIGSLTSLTYLDLLTNSLTEIPVEIGNLTNLKVLIFHNNNLISLPAEIRNLTNLTELYLSYNELTWLPPEIGNLTNLKLLHSGYNKLESVPSEIGNLTNLEELHLYRNQLESLPREIGSLTKLKNLNLSDNDELTSIPSEVCALENTGTTIFKDSGVICE